mgnify:CR=1 FL=1
MENKITRKTTYDEVMNFLNTFDDVDGMLLDFLEDSKPEIKVISGSNEVAYDYDNFLKIFDTEGFEGL